MLPYNDNGNWNKNKENNKAYETTNHSSDVQRGLRTSRRFIYVKEKNETHNSDYWKLFMILQNVVLSMKIYLKR